MIEIYIQVSNIVRYRVFIFHKYKIKDIDIYTNSLGQYLTNYLSMQLAAKRLTAQFLFAHQ